VTIIQKLCITNCQDSRNGIKLQTTSHPYRTSKVISITTTTGYTDQADVPTAGDSSQTFSILKNQGYSVQVCVNLGTFFHDNCRTYETIGNAMQYHYLQHPLMKATDN